MNNSDIHNNLQRIQQNLSECCHSIQRKEDSVTLITVSKTQPVSALMEAYEFGCRDFGENKVQELTSKYEEMPKDVKWHMIGHLQRNKIKYIIDKVALIHSVDSYRLAEAISHEACAKSLCIKILIEVNIAGEESKFGVKPNETENLIRQISLLPGVMIHGLMTIAPYVENPEENRQYFAMLKNLSVDIARKNIDNVYMNVLSMGMTGDYMVAIEEGSNCVRIGTGIFGERKYQI